MKEVELKSVIQECQMKELTAEEQHLIELAIEATQRSYAPYSNFHVGAAVRLDDGIEMIPIEAQTDHLTEVLRYSEQTFTPQTLHVFRLRYQQRKKYTEIASELQISEVAVYKHLAQALKKIKQHFCQVTTL